MALKRRARNIIEGLELEGGEKVLDVGCGDGFYLHLLSNLNMRLKLMGSDFDENALKTAQKRFGKKIKLVRADLMEKLPFPNETFDRIVMSEVAEHLPNDVKGLKEVYRVLKPGGIVCLSVPNANYPLLWDPINWFMERTIGHHIKNGFWAGIWNQHVRLYRPIDLQKSVEKAGLRPQRVESLTWWCLPFNHNILNLGARLLYGKSMFPQIGRAISKYSDQKTKKPIIVRIVFGVFQTIDKLNDLYQPKNSGVGVFIKAVK